MCWCCARLSSSHVSPAIRFETEIEVPKVINIFKDYGHLAKEAEVLQYTNMKTAKESTMEREVLIHLQQGEKEN